MTSPRDRGAAPTPTTPAASASAATVAPALAPDVAQMPGAAALPRRNGELVFDAPWQGRALAMALAVVERLGLPWAEFQSRLIAAIAARPQAPYYECWVAALEALVVDHGVVAPDTLDDACRRVVSG